MNNEDPDVKKMQNFVDIALGKPRYTYPMQVNADKPDPPFASVRKLAEKNPGHDKVEVVKIDDKYYNKISGIRMVLFEVLFTEGDEEQSKFISCFRRQDILNLMKKLDLSVLAHESVTNNSLTLETNWEIRDGVRVKCLVRREYLHETGIIEEVDTTGVYEDSLGGVQMSTYNLVESNNI